MIRTRMELQWAVSKIKDTGLSTLRRNGSEKKKRKEERQPMSLTVISRASESKPVAVWTIGFELILELVPVTTFRAPTSISSV